MGHLEIQRDPLREIKILIGHLKSLDKKNRNDQFSTNNNKVIQLLKKIKPKNIYIKKDDKI